MLESNTAYLITPTNINILCHLSGKTPSVLMANIGWCAVYSEDSPIRWMLMPKATATKFMKYRFDEETYP